MRTHRDAKSSVEIFRDLAISALGDRFGKKLEETIVKVGQLDAVLRAFRPGDGRIYCVQIQLDYRRIVHFALFWNTKYFLRIVICPVRFDLFPRAAGICKIFESFFVNAEKAHRGSVFRGHVGNGRTVLSVQSRGTFAEKLDKFADNIRLAKHFGYTAELYLSPSNPAKARWS